MRRLKRLWGRLRGTVAPDYMDWDAFLEYRKAQMAVYSPVPKGVMVRQYNPPADVFWPSWAAWRFAQGSPELVQLRDIGHESHYAVDENSRKPSAAMHTAAPDSYRLPAQEA